MWALGSAKFHNKGLLFWFKSTSFSHHISTLSSFCILCSRHSPPKKRVTCVSSSRDCQNEEYNKTASVICKIAPFFNFEQHIASSNIFTIQDPIADVPKHYICSHKRNKTSSNANFEYAETSRHPNSCFDARASEIKKF